MNIIKDAVTISMLGMSLLLSACDDSKKPQQPEAEKKASVFDAEKSDVLPYLNIQEQPAKSGAAFL